MRNEFKFENLRVYQDSLSLVSLVYKFTKQWPKSELFGLSSQLQRAAASILLNIAEGSSRTGEDFSHFLSLARGSCFEVVAILTIAKAQGYISPEEFNSAYEACYQLAKMLSKLRSSLTNQASK
jgi:four helix bundle protein